MDRYQNIKPVSKLIGFDFVNDYCIEKELALFNQLSKFLYSYEYFVQNQEVYSPEQKINAQSRNRTGDIRIFSPPLYQLSYLGI